MSVTQLDPTDGPVLAVVALGALVLGRVALLAVVGAAARGSGRAARAARSAARALRPGIVRRVLAAVLGLAAPVAVLPTPAASAAPATAEALAREVDPTPAGNATGALPARKAQPCHVVHQGESLWSIARDHLGEHATDAQVARAWPRWYAANRRVIGPDPSLIVPGQHLRVPGRRSAGTPTQQHAAHAPATGTPVPPAQSLDPDRR